MEKSKRKVLHKCNIGKQKISRQWTLSEDPYQNSLQRPQRSQNVNLVANHLLKQDI